MVLFSSAGPRSASELTELSSRHSSTTMDNTAGVAQALQNFIPTLREEMQTMMVNVFQHTMKDQIQAMIQEALQNQQPSTSARRYESTSQLQPIINAGEKYGLPCETRKDLLKFMEKLSGRNDNQKASRKESDIMTNEIVSFQTNKSFFSIPFHFQIQ